MCAQARLSRALSSVPHSVSNSQFAVTLPFLISQNCLLFFLSFFALNINYKQIENLPKGRRTQYVSKTSFRFYTEFLRSNRITTTLRIYIIKCWKGSQLPIDWPANTVWNRCWSTQFKNNTTFKFIYLQYRDFEKHREWERERVRCDRVDRALTTKSLTTWVTGFMQCAKCCCCQTGRPADRNGRHEYSWILVLSTNYQQQYA